MPDPRAAIGSSVKVTSHTRLHGATSKLWSSQAERDKFKADPVKYLEDAGVAVPKELEVHLRAQAFHLDQVLSGPHDAVAAIAVA